MTSFPPSPKVGSHLSVIAKDWHCGKLYPVTAAQLFLIFTGFLAPDCTDYFIRKELAVLFRWKTREVKNGENVPIEQLWSRFRPCLKALARQFIATFQRR
jgi:hypothetical protein